MRSHVFRRAAKRFGQTDSHLWADARLAVDNVAERLPDDAEHSRAFSNRHTQRLKAVAPDDSTGVHGVNEGFPSNRRSGPFRVSWRDLVNYALIVGAAEDGGAVEMLAGFVEDYGSGGFGSVALVGEAVQNAVRPFAT